MEVKTLNRIRPGFREFLGGRVIDVQMGVVGVLRESVQCSRMSISELRTVVLVVDSDTWNSFSESRYRTFSEYLESVETEDPNDASITHLTASLLRQKEINRTVGETVKKLIEQTVDVRIGFVSEMGNELVSFMKLSSNSFVRVCADHLASLILGHDKLTMSTAYLTQTASELRSAFKAVLRGKTPGLERLLIQFENCTTWKEAWILAGRFAGTLGEVVFSEETGLTYREEDDKKTFRGILTLAGLKFIENEVTIAAGVSGQTVKADLLQKVAPISVGMMSSHPDFYQVKAGKLTLFEVGLVSDPENKKLIEANKWDKLKVISDLVDVSLEVKAYDRRKFREVLRKLPRGRQLTQIWNLIENLRGEAASRFKTSEIPEDEEDENANLSLRDRGKIRAQMPRVEDRKLQEEWANFIKDIDIPASLLSIITKNAYAEPLMPLEECLLVQTVADAITEMDQDDENLRMSPSGNISIQTLERAQSRFFEKLNKDFKREHTDRIWAAKSFFQRAQFTEKDECENQSMEKCECSDLSKRLSSMLNEIVRNNAFVSESKMSISFSVRHKLSRIILCLAAWARSDTTHKELLYLSHLGQAKRIPGPAMLWADGKGFDQLKATIEGKTRKGKKSDLLAEKTITKTVFKKGISNLKGLMKIMNLDVPDIEGNLIDDNLSNKDLKIAIEKVSGRTFDKVFKHQRQERKEEIKKTLAALKEKDEIPADELDLMLEDLEEQLNTDKEAGNSALKVISKIAELLSKETAFSTRTLTKLGQVRYKLVKYLGNPEKSGKYSSYLADLEGKLDELKSALAGLDIKTLDLGVRKAWFGEYEMKKMIREKVTLDSLTAGDWERKQAMAMLRLGEIASGANIKASFSEKLMVLVVALENGLVPCFHSDAFVKTWDYINLVDEMTNQKTAEERVLEFKETIEERKKGEWSKVKFINLRTVDSFNMDIGEEMSPDIERIMDDMKIMMSGSAGDRLSKMVTETISLVIEGAMSTTEGKSLYFDYLLGNSLMKIGKIGRSSGKFRRSVTDKVRIWVKIGRNPDSDYQVRFESSDNKKRTSTVIINRRQPRVLKLGFLNFLMSLYMSCESNGLLGVISEIDPTEKEMNKAREWFKDGCKSVLEAFETQDAMGMVRAVTRWKTPDRISPISLFCRSVVWSAYFIGKPSQENSKPLNAVLQNMRYSYSSRMAVFFDHEQFAPKMVELMRGPYSQMAFVICAALHFYNVDRYSPLKALISARSFELMFSDLIDYLGPLTKITNEMQFANCLYTCHFFDREELDSKKASIAVFNKFHEANMLWSKKVADRKICESCEKILLDEGSIIPRDCCRESIMYLELLTGVQIARSSSPAKSVEWIKEQVQLAFKFTPKHTFSSPHVVKNVIHSKHNEAKDKDISGLANSRFWAEPISEMSDTTNCVKSMVLEMNPSKSLDICKKKMEDRLVSIALTVSKFGKRKGKTKAYKEAISDLADHLADDDDELCKELSERIKKRQNSNGARNEAGTLADQLLVLLRDNRRRVNPRSKKLTEVEKNLRTLWSDHLEDQESMNLEQIPAMLLINIAEVNKYVDLMRELMEPKVDGEMSTYKDLVITEYESDKLAEEMLKEISEFESLRSRFPDLRFDDKIKKLDEKFKMVSAEVGKDSLKIVPSIWMKAKCLDLSRLLRFTALINSAKNGDMKKFFSEVKRDKLTASEIIYIHTESFGEDISDFLRSSKETEGLGDILKFVSFMSVGFKEVRTFELLFELVMTAEHCSEEKVRGRMNVMKLGQSLRTTTSEKVILELVRALADAGTASSFEMAELVANDKDARFVGKTAPKQQFGGERDLVVMDLKTKVMMHCAEKIAEEVLRFDDNDMMVHSERKDEALHTCTRKMEEGDHLNSFSLSLTGSLDQSSWGQNMNPLQMADCLSVKLKGLGNELMNFIKVVGVRGVHKRMFVPEPVMTRAMNMIAYHGWSFKRRPEGWRIVTKEGRVVETNDPEYLKLGEGVRYVIERALFKGRGFVTCYPHMCQGIYHKMSTVFGLMAESFTAAVQKEMASRRNYSIDQFWRRSSDDSIENKTITVDREMSLNDRLNLHKLQILTSNVVRRAFNMTNSPKSIWSNSLAEVYSKFMLNGSFLRPYIKQATAMLTSPLQTTMLMNSNLSYNLARDVYLEGGGLALANFGLALRNWNLISTVGWSSIRRCIEADKDRTWPLCFVPPLWIGHDDMLSDMASYESKRCERELTLQENEIMLKYLPERDWPTFELTMSNTVGNDMTVTPRLSFALWSCLKIEVDASLIMGKISKSNSTRLYEDPTMISMSRKMLDTKAKIQDLANTYGLSKEGVSIKFDMLATGRSKPTNIETTQLKFRTALSSSTIIYNLGNITVSDREVEFRKVTGGYHLILGPEISTNRMFIRGLGLCSLAKLPDASGSRRRMAVIKEEADRLRFVKDVASRVDPAAVSLTKDAVSRCIPELKSVKNLRFGNRVVAKQVNQSPTQVPLNIVMAAFINPSRTKELGIHYDRNKVSRDLKVLEVHRPDVFSVLNEVREHRIQGTMTENDINALNMICQSSAAKGSELVEVTVPNSVRLTWDEVPEALVRYSTFRGHEVTLRGERTVMGEIFEENDRFRELIEALTCITRLPVSDETKLALAIRWDKEKGEEGMTASLAAFAEESKFGSPRLAEIARRISNFLSKGGDPDVQRVMETCELTRREVGSGVMDILTDRQGVLTVYHNSAFEGSELTISCTGSDKTTLGLIRKYVSLGPKIYSNCPTSEHELYDRLRRPKGLVRKINFAFLKRMIRTDTGISLMNVTQMGSNLISMMKLVEVRTPRSDMMGGWGAESCPFTTLKEPILFGSGGRIKLGWNCYGLSDIETADLVNVQLGVMANKIDIGGRSSREVIERLEDITIKEANSVRVSVLMEIGRWAEKYRLPEDVRSYTTEKISFSSLAELRRLKLQFAFDSVDMDEQEVTIVRGASRNLRKDDLGDITRSIGVSTKGERIRSTLISKYLLQTEIIRRSQAAGLTPIERVLPMVLVDHFERTACNMISRNPETVPRIIGGILKQMTSGLRSLRDYNINGSVLKVKRVIASKSRWTELSWLAHAYSSNFSLVGVEKSDLTRSGAVEPITKGSKLTLRVHKGTVSTLLVIMYIAGSSFNNLSAGTGMVSELADLFSGQIDAATYVSMVLEKFRKMNPDESEDLLDLLELESEEVAVLEEATEDDVLEGWIRLKEIKTSLDLGAVAGSDDMPEIVRELAIGLLEDVLEERISEEEISSVIMSKIRKEEETEDAMTVSITDEDASDKEELDEYDPPAEIDTRFDREEWEAHYERSDWAEE
ncbi:MAG: RNA-dependent RNA polymerase [Sanya Bunyavirales-like virus 1]|nr:MAG: RNA-dependent RNA polymerase [Sanya Bunyavirales-like virus 1]